MTPFSRCVSSIYNRVQALSFTLVGIRGVGGGEYRRAGFRPEGWVEPRVLLLPGMGSGRGAAAEVGRVMIPRYLG